MSLSGPSRNPRGRYIVPLMVLHLFVVHTSIWAAPVQLFYGFDAAAGPGGLHPNSDAARSQFLAALGGSTIGVETFESVTLGHIGYVGLSSGRTLTFPTTSVTATAIDFDLTSTTTIANTPGAGNFSFGINGSQYLSSLAGPSGGYFELTFDSPQNGLGFYGSGFSDYPGFGGTVTPIQLTLDGGSPLDTLNVNPTTVPYKSINFFGVVTDTPFTTVRVYNSGPLFDGIGIDDLTIGRLQAVPEPSSLVLAGVAAIIAGAYGRQRYRTAIKPKG